MTSDRWRSVEELYHAASEKPAAEREAFLAQACNGDSALRREVEELLEQSESPAGILDGTAKELLEQADLEPGQTLGPYRILGLIGSGGMGRVYKAVDLRLGRTVAIKVSRAGFTGRFRREARAVAALNHPNICTLYDLGPNYLVMEYVEGSPIKGPMPLAQAVKVVAAIADALDAAHRKGVVHRDLKPANILLTASGPKLLDFGLAKLEPTPGTGLPDSVTWTHTTQATIAGTIQYMAPEQLQGRGADARSDIFSLGLVFYEMLTGRPAFEADNSASLIAAILTSRPEVRRYAPYVPPEIEWALDRALAKDPEGRWQTARDFKAALEWTAAPPPPPPPAARRSRGPWVLAAVFALATAALAWVHWGPKVQWRKPLATMQTVVSQTPQLSLFDRSGRRLGVIGAPADYSNPALSPDGRRLAVSIRGADRKRDIWVFNMAKGGGTRFTSDPADETNPVWSPDGAEIAYCSDRLGRRDIYVRPSQGGPERLLLATEVNKNPLDWARDGSAIYYNADYPTAGHDVWMLPLKGAERLPRVYLRASENRDWLALSPDSRWALYRTRQGVLLRPLLSLSNEWRIGGNGVTEGHWRGDSREVYFISRNTMMAQEVKPDGAGLLLGEATSLFRVPPPNRFGRNAFVVTPDGQRFLIRTGE